MAYTDASSIQGYLQRSLTADETSMLTWLIPAISKWVDSYLGTSFDEAQPGTREYDGTGGRILDIDPCTAITSVVSVNEDFDTDYTYDADDYVAQPQNDNVKDQLVKRHGRWPLGIANIAVTAKFSSYDGSVPEDIKMAVTRIAAGIIQGTWNDDSSAGIKRESIEGHTIEYATSSDTIADIALGDPWIKSVLDARRGILLG